MNENSAPSAPFPPVPVNASAPRLRYFSPWLVALTLVWLVVYCLVFPHPAALAARTSRFLSPL